MRRFRAGEVQLLVATDVVGRGIDVTSISHIINYDIPQFCDDYVHRVGRTGRMGREGVAFTFVTPEEGNELTRIEMRINRLLKRDEIEGFNAVATVAPMRRGSPSPAQRPPTRTKSPPNPTTAARPRRPAAGRRSGIAKGYSSSKTANDVLSAVRPVVYCRRGIWPCRVFSFDSCPKRTVREASLRWQSGADQQPSGQVYQVPIEFLGLLESEHVNYRRATDAEVKAANDQVRNPIAPVLQ